MGVALHTAPVDRKRGFIFGDIHFPFHHKIYLSIAIYICIKWKPDYIVQIGDLKDHYSAAKFPRSYNVFTPKQEDEWSQYYSDLFWLVLNQELPQALKYQILGNHCVRPIKRIVEVAPEYEEDMVEKLHKRYTFDGVKTVYDSREELLIDDICYIHGWGGQLGAHLGLNQMNVVHGHDHKLGLHQRPFGMTGHQIAEMSVGYLADPLSKGLGYTMQKRATKWTHGFGLVDPFGLRPVPLDQSSIEKYSKIPFVQDLMKSF